LVSRETEKQREKRRKREIKKGIEKEREGERKRERKRNYSDDRDGYCAVNWLFNSFSTFNVHFFYYSFTRRRFFATLINGFANG